MEWPFHSRWNGEPIPFQLEWNGVIPFCPEWNELSVPSGLETEFPKLFAKIDGKRWKVAEIPKALSTFMKILGSGLNSPKSYGKQEDKPK